MRLLTAKQASDVLQVPLPRVYELARGVLPPGVVVRIGRQVRFNGDALQKWIANGGTLLSSGECVMEGVNNAARTI
jgi:excisionase family DNA binding protein